MNSFSELSPDISDSGDTADDQLDALFLGLFARFPTEKERVDFGGMMYSNVQRKELISALLISSRFQFVE